MAIEQVVRLMISATYEGAVVCNNVFHFANDTPGIGPGLAPSDLANDFKTAMITTGGGAAGAWRANVTPHITFNNLYYDRLYPDAVGSGNVGLGGVAGTYILGGTWAYTVPVVVAVLTTWRTAVGGRSGRGRTYWAGMVYPNQTVGTPGIAPPWDFTGQAAGSGPAGRANAISSALLTRYSPTVPLYSGWYLVVRSTKTTGKVVPINPAGCYPITDWSIPNYWGTMGSRRGGHGI